MKEQSFYRGIPPDHVKFIKDNYQSVVSIHWSGLTSVTTNLEKEYEFWQEGGVIFQVMARSGKSVSRLSAFPQEEEVILLPNFKAQVSGEMTLNKLDGRWYVILVETQQQKKLVF